MTKLGDFDAYFRSIATGPWAEPTDPGRRVGDALRRLAAHALAGPPDADRLTALAAQLEAISPPHDVPPQGTRYRDIDRPAPDGSRPVRPNANGTHPLAGPRNPVAPVIELHAADEVVYGEVIYDVRFEGLPGLVQGVFIAAAFDLMLGQGVAISGQGGMTGSLSVRYVAPTPLYVPLRYEARFDRRDGRKTFARAALRRGDDDTVCAEAEGVFIAPRPAVSD
jgi:acyl-coenzyme A thioesterase PaaI-like protein